MMVLWKAQESVVSEVKLTFAKTLTSASESKLAGIDTAFSDTRYFNGRFYLLSHKVNLTNAVVFIALKAVKIYRRIRQTIYSLTKHQKMRLI